MTSGGENKKRGEISISYALKKVRETDADVLAAAAPVKNRRTLVVNKLISL